MSENDKYIDDMLEKFTNNELDDFDPKLIISFTGFLLKNLNLTKLNYNLVLDQFDNLEKRIGKISSFYAYEKLPEQMKNQKYQYLLQEQSHAFFKSIIPLVRIVRHEIKNPIKVKSDLLESVKSFWINFTNEELITRYIREWEVQYNTLVNAIYLKLKEQNLLLQDFVRTGRQSEINAISEYMSNNDDIASLTFLFEPLDASLRNSLVHLDYFFDKTGEELIIYDKRKKHMNYQIISSRDFELSVLRLVINRMFLFIIIAKKLGEEIGIEW